MSDPVIVGVDGSARSLEAVVVAAREAHLRAVPLRIVHALGRRTAHPPSTTTTPTGTTGTGTGTGTVQASAGHGPAPPTPTTVADAEEQAHAAAPGVEVFRSVVPGEPRQVLEHESRHAALTVLASRGHSRVTDLLLGSTAVHLAGHSHCPLIVVRGRPDPAGPVLLAVNGTPTEQAAVGFAFTEAALRKASLRAVHVWNTWSERAYEGPGDPLNAMVTDIDHLRAIEEELLEEAVAPLQQAFPHVAVEHRLVRARTRPALIDASREAQLVVVDPGPHGAVGGLLLGSVGQTLLHHAHCPVALVRGRQ